ncbi:MAG: site-specific integrase [Clostridia bacterium]|nr:site-specific integrase [Clostridia bacterium]
MKYKEWLEEWLAHYVKPSAKIRTYERYRELTLHIVPKIGECDLNELSPILLQKFVSDLLSSGNRKTGKGLSANTVNAVISVVQSSLRTASTIGLTDTYSADKIKRPKITEKLVECFSLTEQKAIEQAVLNGKKPKLIGIVICLYTGLRIGELLALEWTDIDFTKGIITVSKSCHYGRDQDGKYARFIDTPKTYHSIREIPIPKQLIPLLKKHRKDSNCDFVVSDHGNPVAVRSYQRSFELLQRKLKIRRRGFHALRHTFATRAIECGMDVNTLSEILGHKSPTITLNRYAHSLLEHKTEMMNRIGKLL